MKIYSLAFLSATVLIGLTSAASARCEVRWSASFGNDTVGVMLADSGKRCSSGIRHRNGWMESLTIVSPAHNGTAAAEGLAGISYQSKPGFHGTDTFTFQTDYGPQKGKSNITMQVTVN